MTANIPGDLLILIALIFNVLAGIFFFLVAKGKYSFEGLAKRSYVVFTVCITLAVAYLYYLFFTHNFDIRYVYDYSDRSLPFFYILSAFWGGQEGTYLLWVFFSALAGFIVIYKGKQYRYYGMVIYSLINLFFLSILVKLSPFAMMNFHPLNGAGLNPLLQDPWMVVHPPVVFVGYAMSAVPFAILISALIINDYSQWVKTAFPWVVVTALMLGAGNILGAYWAYKTLGWGGFWGWDPVENSSFIPWFVSLALLHGLIIEKRSGALRKTNILMTSFVFILVIYGTFLTRSGVLADFSVHSFVDLGINQYLVGFLVFYIIMTLVSFFIRIKALGHVPLNYNFYNREFILFSGMVLLFLFAAIVLFWTSLPITSGIFMDRPSAADVATYNHFALPFAVIFSLFLSISPFTNYNSFTLKNWKMKLILTGLIVVAIGFGLFHFVFHSSLLFSAIFSLVVTALIMYMLKPDLLKTLIPSLVIFLLTIVFGLILKIHNLMYILFFASAAMVVMSSIIAISNYIPHRWKTAGGLVAHLGFGLMIIGVLGSSAFSTDKKLVLPRNVSDQAYGLSISYNGMEHNMDYPKNKLLLSYKENGKVYQARPQLYYSQKLNGIMRKPFIEKKMLNDLYFSPQEIQQLQDNEHFTLFKDKPIEVDKYKFTFTDFKMDQHNPDSGMVVIADVKLEHDGQISDLKPAVKVTTQNNKNVTIDVPAKFGDKNQYSMTIEHILADQGAVQIHLSGLVSSGPTDRLILDISKKPVINLVWLGTTLILLGMIIVFIRRKTETNH